MPFIRISLTLWQSCAARFKDLMSLYNGPTFTVLVMLRIASSFASSPTEQQLLLDQGMRNVAKGKHRVNDNTQTKIRSNSANVTECIIAVFFLFKKI